MNWLWLLIGGAVVAGPARAAEWTVHAGEKIQDALAKAQAGDVVKVYPGTFHEALYVDRPNITLRGVIEGGAWPALDGGGDLNDGVVAAGAGFTIEDLRIAHYKGNGVMTQGADNVKIRRLIVEDTGIYGIYPTLGRNVVVEDNIVTGIADAAIYIGMCQHADVRRNVVYGNVAGIELENTEHALVEANEVHDNTGGVLVFTLPGLPRKTNDDSIIRDNFIAGNNHRNFGAAGSIVASVPPGTGILVLAAHHVQIEDNVIRDHGLAAVIVASMDVVPGLSADAEVDPVPSDVAFRRNVVSGNGRRTLPFLLTWYHYIARNLLAGGSPDGTAEDLLPKGADVVVQGKGAKICLANPDSYTKMGRSDAVVPCGEAPATGAILSMLAPKDGAVQAPAQGPGEAVYAAVCSGCHAADFRRVGPALTEIRGKYAGNPAGIVQFATAPHQVRSGFPPMPPQAYLGQTKLEAVARYLLGLETTH